MTAATHTNCEESEGVGGGALGPGVGVETQHPNVSWANGQSQAHADGGCVVTPAGLDVEDTLRSIVRTAMRLVDARYGALGVRDHGRGLSEFVHEGIDDAQCDRIGALPTGIGVLGLITDNADVVRLDSISDQPSSVGFPPGHPPMSSFLGAPVTIGDAVYGNIYLTEKRDGAHFTRDDEVIIRALAAAAGFAIENARLYEQAQTRTLWIEATRDIVTELLSGTDTDEVLDLVARTARELTAADLTFIALPSEHQAADGQPTGLVIAVADGDTNGDAVGRSIPLQGSTSGRAFRERRAARSESLDFTPMPDADAFGPALVAPMCTGEAVIGVLVSLRYRAGPAFTDDMVPLLSSFSDQAALAMSMADSAEQKRQLTTLADRDRIARDLHDHVIQRIFAAGLSLQSTAHRTTSPDVTGRLDNTINDLQDVIQDIRAAIFDLHESRTGPDNNVRHRIQNAVDELTEAHPMRFMVRTTGPLSVITPTLAEHIVAVVRESVSNAIQHCGGAEGTVTVTVSDDLVVSVVDDGVGIAQDRHRRGLANLESRARDCGGTLNVGAPAGGRGTEIIWSAPLT